MTDAASIQALLSSVITANNYPPDHESVLTVELATTIPAWRFDAILEALKRHPEVAGVTVERFGKVTVLLRGKVHRVMVNGRIQL